VVSDSFNAEAKRSSSLTLSPMEKKKKGINKEKNSLVYCVDNVRVVDAHRCAFYTYLFYMSCLRIKMISKVCFLMHHPDLMV